MQVFGAGGITICKICKFSGFKWFGIVKFASFRRREIFPENVQILHFALRQFFASELNLLLPHRRRGAWSNFSVLSVGDAFCSKGNSLLRLMGGAEPGKNSSVLFA